LARRRSDPGAVVRRGGARILFLSAAVALAASSCAKLPRARGEGVEVGVASWYGGEFHGRPTSSREVFDMNDMTAAHRTLPFGTHVLVTNLENDRTVVVRINDRGPFVRGRVIDLSYAAARVLGLIGPGTARVRLETLSGVREPAPSPAAIWLQVGAFSVQENAHALKRRLEGTYPGVLVTTFKTPAGTYYRVRLKADASTVDALAGRLAAEGIPVIIIRE
jgi:peptidoglycan lytic transglycosylase